MRILSLIICISVIATMLPLANAGIYDPRALNADPATAQKQIAPVLEGLGDNHFKVTTKSEKSQQFFDQGLRLSYAFNHSEALRAFKESARLDPENAMAYWGWALVLGPHVNLKMIADVAPQANKAAQLAMDKRDKVTDVERLLIEALAARYESQEPSDRTYLNVAYADAMQRLAQKFPDDSDVNTLYAASIMNIYGRDYWYADGSPKPRILDAKKTLQDVVDKNPKHAGALHYFIHLMESPHPKLAEPHADMIADLMPGAGHITHMPSHIYMRVGRFTDSYNVNVKAAKADQKYLTQCQAQGFYPLIYYPHNVHFMAWSAMVQGRPKEALDAARKIVDKIPPEQSKNAGLWAMYEKFLSQPMFVLIRFGMWEEMLKEPKPAENSPLMIGIWHYGRALAFIHTDKIAQAEAELEQINSSLDAADGAAKFLSGSTSQTLMTIAQQIVTGELAFAKGDQFAGIAHLERAVRIEDGMRYNEPPDWYFPVRQFLGAMLLDSELPKEAEVVYAADLKKNPGNGYSLFGLTRALEKQGKLEDAKIFNEKFEKAWADATHELTSSRF